MLTKIKTETIQRIKILFNTVEFDEQEQKMLVAEATNNRTTSVKELTPKESVKVQKTILDTQKFAAVIQMRKKVIAIYKDLAHIAPKYFQNTSEHLNNYLATNKRLFKNRTKLSYYPHSELVKLITQLEAMRNNLTKANSKRLKIVHSNLNKNETTL